MRHKLLSVAFSAFKYIFLSLISLFSLLPFYWMISISLQSETEVLKYPPTFFPQSVQWDNYLTIFNSTSFGTYFLNSIIVSIIETIVVTVVSVFAAYGFCYMQNKARKTLMLFCLVVNFIPFEVVMAYNYRFMVNLSLVDTLIAIMLPFFCNFFYALILYNAFRMIPEHLYVSAMSNGASSIKYFLKIALPHIKSSVIFVALLSFIASWNAFIWPALVTNSDFCRTLPFGIYNYMSDLGAKKELVMAMSVLTELPVVIICALTRNTFVSGFKRVN